MKALFLSLSTLFALLIVSACSSKPPTPSPTPEPTPSTSPTPQPSSFYVCVELANVRTGPGVDYPVLKQLTQGTAITPLKKSGEWYYLGQDDTQNDSYIHESVVCSQTDATVAPDAVTTSPGTPESSAITGICPDGCIEEGNGCVIKGNISSKTSAKTYYMPGDPGYGLVVIDPDYGERWFCTEAEAKANGWRRSSQ
jgi:Bacterial SH3 domain